MKLNKTIIKSVIGKIIVGILLLAIIGSVLVSCGSSSSKEVELSSNVATTEGGAEADILNKIGKFMLNNSDAKEAFVAAYRGYDMTAEGFDKNAECPYIGVNLEYAKKVIEKYMTGDNVIKTETLVDKDVENIVLAVQENIDIEAKRGVIATIQYWIGVALGAITKTVGFGNYIVGICIFAVVIEILMLPLGISQQKNSIKQAKLRPKEMAIRKKYAGRNDQATQQKINEEIQALYQAENFNPASGCLPLLIQMPIIIILYNVVIDPIQYVLGYASTLSNAVKVFFTTAKAAGGLGMSVGSKNGTIEIMSYIKDADLSGIKDFAFFKNGSAILDALEKVKENIPSFNIGKLNCGITPSFTFTYPEVLLLIIPVLTFVVYYFSMKLTKKFTYQGTMNEQMNGCSMKVMDFSMPLMSVFFTFVLPGVIGIYWIFRSIIGTLKSFVLSKAMPFPKFTEEDYKNAEKEYNSKNAGRKNITSASTDGQKVRSLHHIDDDDPDYVPTPKKKEPKSTPIEEAPLKNDDDKPSNEKTEAVEETIETVNDTVEENNENKEENK